MLDKITRQELLSAEKRKWDEILEATSVYVIPNRKKHESGWACMDFVAATENGFVRFGGTCDDVRFRGDHFHMDCTYQTRIIHIWNPNSFRITEDLSSIDFIEKEKNNE